MFDGDNLLVILGIVVVVAVIYFISRSRKDSNVKPHITDESMNDPLGPVHVNSDTDSSFNALGEDQFKNSVPVREGQAAQKQQNLNDQYARDEDEASEAVDIEIEPATDDNDPLESSASSVNHQNYHLATYQELVDNNGLRDQSVELEGVIASYYTENLGVEGAKALASLNTDKEDPSQLVALKFVNDVQQVLASGDSVKVYGQMQGLKVSNKQLVPAMLVEKVEKV